jgi:hypothetical protein
MMACTACRERLHPRERAFRRRYSGRRLAVVGGVPRADQVRKLERLGVRVTWIPTGRSSRPRRNGLALARVRRQRFDFVVLFIRCLSHGLSRDVKDAVRRANRASGGRGTVCVESRTLNPEVIAGALLAHAPGMAGEADADGGPGREVEAVADALV